MEGYQRAPFAISIHSPRMGRDHDLPVSSTAAMIEHFNPLSPHGERPAGRSVAFDRVDFNPLSPHGERRVNGEIVLERYAFQSTLPAWGETYEEDDKALAAEISIHSPRMGRDSERTQLFEEKNWRICTTLYLFASKEVLPADKKLFREKKQTVFFGANRTGKPWELPYRTNH